MGQTAASRPSPLGECTVGTLGMAMFIAITIYYSLAAWFNRLVELPRFATFCSGNVQRAGRAMRNVDCLPLGWEGIRMGQACLHRANKGP